MYFTLRKITYHTATYLQVRNHVNFWGGSRNPLKKGMGPMLPYTMHINTYTHMHTQYFVSRDPSKWTRGMKCGKEYQI